MDKFVHIAKNNNILIFIKNIKPISIVAQALLLLAVKNKQGGLRDEILFRSRSAFGVMNPWVCLECMKFDVNNGPPCSSSHETKKFQKNVNSFSGYSKRLP